MWAPCKWHVSSFGLCNQHSECTWPRRCMKHNHRHSLYPSLDHFSHHPCMLAGHISVLNCSNQLSSLGHLCTTCLFDRHRTNCLHSQCRFLAHFGPCRHIWGCCKLDSSMPRTYRCLDRPYWHNHSLSHTAYPLCKWDSRLHNQCRSHCHFAPYHHMMLRHRLHLCILRSCNLLGVGRPFRLCTLGNQKIHRNPRLSRSHLALRCGMLHLWRCKFRMLLAQFCCKMCSAFRIQHNLQCIGTFGQPCRHHNRNHRNQHQIPCH